MDREDIHLALLDVMMPVMDGITCLSKLRESHNLPVILLTAKSEDTDKITGLSFGADDYVTKPFSPLELVARVKSQLRRYMQLGGIHSASDEVRIGRLCFDFSAHTLTVDGEPVRLTFTENKILPSSTLPAIFTVDALP